MKKALAVSLGILLITCYSTRPSESTVSPDETSENRKIQTLREETMEKLRKKRKEQAENEREEEGTLYRKIPVFVSKSEKDAIPIPTDIPEADIRFVKPEIGDIKRNIRR